MQSFVCVMSSGSGGSAIGRALCRVLYEPALPAVWPPKEVRVCPRCALCCCPLSCCPLSYSRLLLLDPKNGNVTARQSAVLSTSVFLSVATRAIIVALSFTENLLAHLVFPHVPDEAGVIRGK